jgi:uncharacterized membrane protein (DUF4010 family)
MMPPMSDQLTMIGLSAALGLLVGLQREFSGNSLAGIRTFPLIAVLGTLAGLLAPQFGAWLIAAGLVVIGALLIMGNFRRSDENGSGLTTEISALLMYLVGVYIVAGSAHGSTIVAVVVASTLAVLLHLKKPLHDFVKRIGPHDIKAVMQFVVISLIILPLLPDETFGPYGVLNPRSIWWMVVLIVGVELAAYVLYRLVGERAGSFLGGLVGGLVSSTATTAAFARRYKMNPVNIETSSMVITLASTVAFVRVLVLGALLAPNHVQAIAWPLGIMVALLLCLVLVQALFRKRETVDLPQAGNPAELKPALIFAGLYAVITLGIAAANDHFGNSGLYVVAVISGLTDMDAITLSTARMMANGHVIADTGWRLILIAGLANLVFKGGMTYFLGGKQLGHRVNIAFGIALLAGIGLVWLWP